MLLLFCFNKNASLLHLYWKIHRITTKSKRNNKEMNFYDKIYKWRNEFLFEDLSANKFLFPILLIQLFYRFKKGNWYEQSLKITWNFFIFPGFSILKLYMLIQNFSFLYMFTGTSTTRTNKNLKHFPSFISNFI